MITILLLIFIFNNIPMVNSIVCYQCTDCPEPFTENYPYVTVTNNTNFLAQCTKSVANLGDGRRLVSKGSIFYCPSAVSGSGDVQLYCCGSDYCNSSVHLGSSIVLLLFTVIRIYICE